MDALSGSVQRVSAWAFASWPPARVPAARNGDALEADPSRRRTPEAVPVTTMAASVGATMQGMSQSARDGANTDELHAIANLALASLTAPSA